LIQEASKYSVCVSLRLDFVVAEEEKDLRLDRGSATQSEVVRQISRQHGFAAARFTCNPE
jgi:hypothetical protein